MNKNDPPKTLVIGANGFVGRHFFHFYRQFYPDLIGTHHTPTEHLTPFELSDSLKKLNLSPGDYQYALIAAGIANPYRCAQDPEESFHHNVTATLSLCRECLAKEITPIVFSTDYVFDGSKASYDEYDQPTPLNDYGKQKANLEKEAEVLPCLIIRLSKVYGNKPGDKSLIDEMVTTLREKRELRAAHDQIFAPISITDVVKGITLLQQERALGLYNFAGPSIIDRYSLALKVASRLHNNASSIRKISLNDLNELFLRPKRTVLNSEKLCKQTGLEMTTLDRALDNYGL